jgi:hypothetical protein
MLVLCVALIAMAWWRMTRVRERAARAAGKHPVAAAGALATMYTAFAAWTFLAWYSGRRRIKYKWGGDGWFGVNTYVGGSDKLGHAMGTMMLARLGTLVLAEYGGYDRKRSAIASASLAELLFLGVEVKDGFYSEFSFSDLAGNTAGALLAIVFDTIPRANELFGFRIDYFPSEMYLRHLRGDSPCPPSSCSRWNLVEDYTGETFLFALHLGGIRAIRERHGTWSRFVDVAVGFDARNYRPIPDLDLVEPSHQDLSLGLAFNAQGFSDWLLEDRTSRGAIATRKVLHAIFEVINLPFARLPMVQWSRARAPQKRAIAAAFTPRAGALARARARATRRR